MEIRGPNPNFDKPIQPQGPEGAGGPGKTEKAGFGEATGVGQTSGAGATGATNGAAAASAAAANLQPNFTVLASRIQQGIAAGQGKQEILASLVNEQVQTQFGKGASPQLVAAVTERFQNDPTLSQLFNRLFASASK